MADQLELRRLGDDEFPATGEGELLCKVASKEEAHLLVAAFPGSGRCCVWDPEQRRSISIMSWQNGRSAN